MRKNGKVIQVEKIRINGTLVDVPLRLVRDNRYGSKVADFHYEVHLDEPAVRVLHADPKECIKLAVEKLEAALSIKWSPMIAVIVEEGGDPDAYQGGFGRVFGDKHLSMRVALVDRGVRTDGVELLQERDRNGRVHAVRLEEGTSYIPDTPENRTRVEAILTALDQLGKRLHALLAQGNIQKTLANLKMLALPAPPPERPRARRKS